MVAAKTPHVAKILCATDIPARGEGLQTLSAAQCEDGNFRLYLGSEPLDAGTWGPSDLNACIDAFLAKRLEMRLAESFSTALT